MHNLLTDFLITRHLGGSPLFAIMNNALVNFFAHVVFSQYLDFFREENPRFSRVELPHQSSVSHIAQLISKCSVIYTTTENIIIVADIH